MAAALIQKHDGINKVVMFASRATTKPEKKYAAYEHECLAAVWAIELFRHYVQNKPFTLATDCASIKWLQNRQNGSRVLRWALRLQEFDFTVVHRPGKLNQPCDSLSRDSLKSSNPYGEPEVEALYTVRTRARPNAEHTDDPEATQAPTKKAKPNRIAKPVSARHRQATQERDFSGRDTNNNPFTRPETDAEWVAAQAIDTPMMSHIRSELTRESSAYSTTETGIIVRKNPKTGNLQVVVPKHLQEIMCYLHHNLPLSAHQGAKRALAALTRS